MTLAKVKTFLEMIKFEHSIFALPFAYLGLVLAEGGRPRLRIFLWVTAAMVSFRTFGMALNRLLDREIDSRNPRTRGRALPAGALKPGFVWAVTALSLFLFELSARRLGPLPFSLSPIPVLLAVLYPFTKRFTWLSHFVLGSILGIAPYGAWLASRGECSWIPGLVTLGVASWAAGFDMIYALQDTDFDRKEGLYSFPARFGTEATLGVTACLHVLTLAAWGGAGILAGLGGLYFSGGILAAIFLLREHWLLRAHGPGKIQEAFFTMNAVVSLVIFLAVFLDLSFRRSLL